MMRRLNDTTVKSLPPPTTADRVEYWFDEKGLGLRVSKTGRKTWVYVYHFDGKSRRMTFGHYPTISVAQVRAKHAESLLLLQGGVDPGNEIQVARAAQRDAPTVRVLAEQYLDIHASKKKSGAEDRRILNRDVLPAVGEMKAQDVRREDVRRLIESIVARGAPIGANRTLAVVRKMYNFGIERSLVEANPCDHLRQPAANVTRDKVLTPSEIRTFWNRLKDCRMAEGIKIALRLQLLLAQRKGELASAEWKEIDWESQVWTIPAAKAKNGLAHRVPLTPSALTLFRQLHELVGDSSFCFPSRTGEGAITDGAINRAVKNNEGLLGVSNVTPHDLRRTAASYMTGIGVPRLVVAKILNHADAGVTAIYDRHSYDREKRQALELWSDALVKIVEGSGTAAEVQPAPV